MKNGRDEKMSTKNLSDRKGVDENKRERKKQTKCVYEKMENENMRERKKKQPDE